MDKLILKFGELGNIQSSLDYFLKFNIPKNAKILDIGCNYGSLINNLYNLGYKNISGSDINQNAVVAGKKNYKEISSNLYIQKDNTLPFFDESFDIILMFDVIEHISDIKNFLKEDVYRVLKKEGMFIFQTPNKPMNILWVYLDNHSFKIKWWEEHCSLQTFWSLKKLLVNSGFHSLVIEKYNVWTEHNKNKVKKKLGFFGIILLKCVSILPIYIYTNFWGHAKK